jgi:hypothetical protein
MRRLFAALVLLAFTAPAVAQPKLVRHGQAVQLEVQSKPFLMRGGELSAIPRRRAQPTWRRSGRSFEQ